MADIADARHDDPVSPTPQHIETVQTQVTALLRMDTGLANPDEYFALVRDDLEDALGARAQLKHRRQCVQTLR
jgi:hypothetical protein